MHLFVGPPGFWILKMSSTMFQTEIKSTFARNVGEALEEAFGKDVVQGWKKICRWWWWVRWQWEWTWPLSKQVFYGLRIGYEFCEEDVCWVENFLSLRFFHILAQSKSKWCIWWIVVLFHFICVVIMKKPSLSSATGMSCFYQQYNYHKIPCGTIINHYHGLPVFKIVLEYEDTPEQHSVRMRHYLNTRK